MENGLEDLLLLFQYKVIFFELINIPAIFQDYINKIWVKKLNVFVIMNFDNIFIYTKSEGKKYVKVL